MYMKMLENVICLGSENLRKKSFRKKTDIVG